MSEPVEADWRAAFEAALVHVPLSPMRLAIVWRAVFAHGVDAPPPPGVDASVWRAVRASVAPVASLGLPSDAVIAALVEAPPGTEGAPGSRRRALGAFHTPSGLAKALARATLPLASARPGGAPPRVLDPACGAGALLIAAFDERVGRGSSPAATLASLAGWDLDPVAVEVCRLRLHARAGALGAALALPWPGATGAFRVGDTLRCVPEALVTTGESPDVILANPPFGNAIGQATAREADEQHRYRAAYPIAATGAYDRAGLFVEWAVRATTGPVGVLVPRALLAAPYATALRAWVERTKPLRDVVRVDRHDAFRDAAVHVAGLVLSSAGPDAASMSRNSGIAASSWSARTSALGAAAVLAVDAASGATLADSVTLSASCAVGEAYAWRDVVAEDGTADAPTYRLVTSGALDPLVVRWGEQAQRYLKTTYERPVVPRSVLSARRATQARSPKVLMPGLSAVLEAAVDEAGDYVGAVATLTLMAREGAASAQVPVLRAVALYLNSALARGWFLAHFGASGLSGGSVQVTKNKLAALPMPRWVVAGAGGVAELGGSSAARHLEALASPLPGLSPTHAPSASWFDAAQALGVGGVSGLDAAQARAGFHALSAMPAPSSGVALTRRLAAASLALVLASGSGGASS